MNDPDDQDGFGQWDGRTRRHPKVDYYEEPDFTRKKDRMNDPKHTEKPKDNTLPYDSDVWEQLRGHTGEIQALREEVSKVQKKLDRGGRRQIRVETKTDTTFRTKIEVAILVVLLSILIILVLRR